MQLIDLKNKKLIPLGVFIVLIVITLGVYWGASRLLEQQIVHDKTQELTRIHGQTMERLKQSLAESKNKLIFLHSTPPISGLSRSMSHNGIDPLDGTTTAQWKLRLTTIFIGFIQSNPEIRQIRFIGKANNGKELIRVERNANRVVITPEALLQDKGQTDYYSAISGLKDDEVYISDITLNREHEVIDNPMWPTIRFAEPVYDENYQFFGFVIINVDASHLIDFIKQDFKKTVFNLYVLNTDGFFIAAPKQSLTFGFDLNRPLATWNNLTNNAPLPLFDELATVSFDKQQTLVFGNQLVLSRYQDRSLYIVSAISMQHINEILNQQRVYLVLLLALLLVIVIVMVFVYQHYINKLLSLYDDQSRYEAIISGSSDAIINLDINGNILDWNESSTYLFNLSNINAKAITFFDLFKLDNNQQHALSQTVFSEIIEQNTARRIELESTAESGETKFFNLNLSPVLPKNAAIAPSVSALIRDVTESRRNQQKITSLNESLEKQVQQRTKQLEAATAEATAANHTKSAFVANISHEIRTPLNGISGMLELLHREPLSDKQLSYINMAKNSASTLAVLINDLLDMTKIESGKLDIEHASFNLLETVSVVVSTMSLKTSEKGLGLLLDCTGVQHENVISDSHRLKQILVNVLGNAIKFTEKGSITVAVMTKADPSIKNAVYVEVSIKDTGIGITQTNLVKLFKPFTQADNSIEKQFGGTGLGLSISKQLAALLGGDISVSSEIGKGSIFTVKIQAKIDSAIKDKYIGPILAGRDCCVVMPDNSESELVIRQLETWGANVRALSTIEALYQLEGQELPDLLVVDDEKDDANFANWQRKHSADKKCKLLLVTQLSNHAASVTEDENCIHVSRPLLPLDLLISYKMLRHPELKTEHLQTGQDATNDKNQNHHSVLIVDDNEINRFVAKGLLEQLPINIVTATNGAEAIDYLKGMQDDDSMDLILMDCQMPIMDGFEATKLIRQGGAGQRAKNIPIVAMTAGAMSGDKDSCIQAGMNDFIAKPLDAKSYEQKVMQWLEKTS